MSPTLCRLVAASLFAAAVGPAFAGGFTIDRAQVTAVLAPAEACGYDRARAALKNNDMVLLADVPRTPAAYRFIVKWKGDVWGANVYTANCKIDEVYRPAAQHPWCEYMPGVRIQCPMAMSQ